LLSEDAIAVTGVTELEGGLVEGLNNRVYLRATTADGQVLEGVTLNVKRLWEPTDRGTDTEVDEDGVASLQLDPGPAVNVVIPAAPLRPPPKAKAVQRTNFVDLLAEDGEVSLAIASASIGWSLGSMPALASSRARTSPRPSGWPSRQTGPCSGVPPAAVA
jgi:hypothetical protein